MSHVQVNLSALFDPAVRPDPYGVLRELRETSPSMVVDGVIVVGNHADCDRVLRVPTVSSDRRKARVASLTSPQRQRSFLMLDPPDHTRLRGLVSKAFTPRTVARLAPRIAEIIDGSLAAADPRGWDVVRDFAYPLPVRVICELFGVPESDHELLTGWSRTLARTLEPPLSATARDDIAAAERAVAEFGGYVRELVERRRAHPGDDLLSRLVEIEEQGDQLTEDELVATAILLLVAGHETTANLIANGVVALLRHPDQLAALRADPARSGQVVEEVLRYDTPVQFTSRVALAPMRVGDVQVGEGDIVMLLLAAANRDPAVFPDPDRFDTGRTGGGHLSFAAGPHFCLGAGLARLEAGMALTALARRVEEPVLDEDALRYRPHVNLRGPSRLVVTCVAVG
ncbi:MAG TPA: cytochrome P450 [Thermopolyspora sp.]